MKRRLSAKDPRRLSWPERRERIQAWAAVILVVWVVIHTADLALDWSGAPAKLVRAAEGGNQVAIQNADRLAQLKGEITAAIREQNAVIAEQGRQIERLVVVVEELRKAGQLQEKRAMGPRK